MFNQYQWFNHIFLIFPWKYNQSERLNFTNISWTRPIRDKSCQGQVLSGVSLSGKSPVRDTRQALSGTSPVRDKSHEGQGPSATSPVRDKPCRGQALSGTSPVWDHLVELHQQHQLSLEWISPRIERVGGSLAWIWNFILISMYFWCGFSISCEISWKT